MQDLSSHYNSPRYSCLGHAWVVRNAVFTSAGWSRFSGFRNGSLRFRLFVWVWRFGLQAIFFGYLLVIYLTSRTLTFGNRRNVKSLGRMLSLSQRHGVAIPNPKLPLKACWTDPWASKREPPTKRCARCSWAECFGLMLDKSLWLWV